MWPALVYITQIQYQPFLILYELMGFGTVSFPDILDLILDCIYLIFFNVLRAWNIPSLQFSHTSSE